MGDDMKRINVAKAMAVLALALVSSASHAEFAKYEFTAHAVTAGVDGDATGLPSSGPANFIGVGTTFTGYFYYDLTTPINYSGSNGAGGTFAGYLGTDAQVGIHFTSSTGYTFVSNSSAPGYEPRVDVEDNAVGPSSANDVVQVYGNGATAANFAQDATLKLVDKHGGATFSGTALPPALSLADYSGEITFYWTDNVGDRAFNFVASLDTMKQVSAVPEPETYAMLLAGLALVGVIRRRQQQA